jgi:hypothetical protein
MESLDIYNEDPALFGDHITSLYNKWKGIEYISAIPVLTHVFKAKKREWRSLESEWKRTHLSMPSSSTHDWDISQCTRWLKSVEIIPAYLGPETRSKLEEVKKAVDERLETIPVLAAVTAFNRLSPAQKKTFLSMISAMEGQESAGHAEA